MCDSTRERDENDDAYYPRAHKKQRYMRLWRQQKLFWRKGDAIGCVLFLLHMKFGNLSPAYDACRGRIVSCFRPVPLCDSDSSDSETPSEQQKREAEWAEYESSMEMMERIAPEDSVVGLTEEELNGIGFVRIPHTDSWMLRDGASMERGGVFAGFPD